MHKGPKEINAYIGSVLSFTIGGREVLFLCGVENKWFAQKNDVGSGCIKLYIDSLNDTHQSWLQLMIEKMWVVVTCPHAVELHIG